MLKRSDEIGKEIIQCYENIRKWYECLSGMVGTLYPPIVHGYIADEFEKLRNLERKINGEGQ